MILIFSITVTVLYGVMIRYNKDRVSSGRIDLDQSGIYQNHVIPLSGEWQFYWQALINPEMSNVKEGKMVRVPSVWNGIDYFGEPVEGKGYATYVLKVDNAIVGEPLGLRIENFSTAYSCYIDGVVVAENGAVGISEEASKPYYEPKVIQYTPTKTQFDIVIHVSNYTYARGGFWYNIFLGKIEEVRQVDDLILFKDALVIGSLLMMGIYFFSHYMLIRKARYSIFFVLMCILMILRTALYGDYLLIRVFPNVPFDFMVYLTYLIIIWFPITLIWMMQSFSESIMSINVLKSLSAVALIFTMILSMLPVYTFTKAIYVLEVLAFFIVIYAILKMSQAYLTRKIDSVIPLIGTWLVFLSGLRDVLYQANLVDNVFGEWTPLSLVIFMYMLTYMMNKRYALAFNESLDYGARLQNTLNEQVVLTQELMRLDKQKDQFLANTSHELRTPLNGILNISDSLLKGFGGTLTSEQSKSLETIRNASQRLYRLINDLLDASLIKENKLILNIQDLDVHMVVEDCIDTFRFMNGQSHVQIVSFIKPNQYFIKSDEERLKQVLINVIGNAIKYTDRGTVTVEAEQEGEALILSVTDEGIGISEQDMRVIYDMFTRANTSEVIKKEGAGLGLYITKQLMDYLGGQIQVHSKLGEGTVFKLTFALDGKSILPAEETNQTEGPESEDVSQGPEDFDFSTNLRGFAEEEDIRILIVDDSDANRTALKNHLNLVGIQCDEASHGYQAIDMIESEKLYHIILLDIMMPGISGFDVLKRLRNLYDAIERPVIMLTARISEHDVSRALEMGANDYLTKPYESSELYARVQNILGYQRTYRKLLGMELSFLQAQIKPHFVFNALSVISSLSIRNPSQAKNLILDLADYLRLSFDFDNHTGLSTLEREIDLVKAYVAIETARFEDLIEFDMAIEESIDLTLPVLCMQPLVENAIKHGVLKFSTKGKVILSVKWQEDSVRVSVGDTGKGIPEEIQMKILSGEGFSGHVGLYNIHKRLKKLYGKGLCFTKDDTYGSIVYFDVPYVTREVVDENTHR